MWKNNLIARFHHRRDPSSIAHAPLIPREGSRPVSTATLESVPELQQLDGDEEQERQPSRQVISAEVPAAANGQLAVAVTTTNLDEQATRDIEAIHLLGMRNIRSFFMEEIDTVRAIAPLSAYCYMTGFMDAVSLSAIFVWCAFQTGNSVQLSLALARLFNGQHDTSFHIADQQALCSVLCFLFGAFIGRIGDKIGCKTRAWMTFGTIIQTLFTMAAAIAIWKSGSGSVGDDRGDPAWSDTLSFVTIGFMSASMGLQGIMGKRLNTQFTTTVVLTSTWCELMTEPQLFNVWQLVPSRDHKIIAIFFLFVGAFTSRLMLDKIGSAGTLGVGTGLRLVITLSWLLVPAKKAK